jgi:hypothetical protein
LVRARTLVSASLALAALAVVAGCVQTPMPTPTPTPSASPTSHTNAPKPQLRPGQSAAANKQYFDLIVNNTFAAIAGHRIDGRAIVDSLVTAGFVKSDLEVTYDETALGIPADSVVFSVRIQSDCLIGQISNTLVTTTLAPLLGTGSCLVGQQRPIDW